MENLIILKEDSIVNDFIAWDIFSKIVNDIFGVCDLKFTDYRFMSYEHEGNTYIVANRNKLYYFLKIAKGEDLINFYNIAYEHGTITRFNTLQEEITIFPGISYSIRNNITRLYEDISVETVDDQQRVYYYKYSLKFNKAVTYVFNDMTYSFSHHGESMQYLHTGKLNSLPSKVIIAKNVEKVMKRKSDLLSGLLDMQVFFKGDFVNDKISEDLKDVYFKSFYKRDSKVVLLNNFKRMLSIEEINELIIDNNIDPSINARIINLFNGTDPIINEHLAMIEEIRLKLEKPKKLILD